MKLTFYHYTTQERLHDLICVHVFYLQFYYLISLFIKAMNIILAMFRRKAFLHWLVF